MGRSNYRTNYVINRHPDNRSVKGASCHELVINGEKATSFVMWIIQ